MTNPFLAALLARAHGEGVDGVNASPAAALHWAALALAPGACDPEHATVQKDSLVSVGALLENFFNAPSAPARAAAGGGRLQPPAPAVADLMHGVLAALRRLADAPAWAGSDVASFALWQAHRIHHYLALRAPDADDRDIQQGADVALLEKLAGTGRECSGCAAASLYVAYRDGSLGVKKSERLKKKWQARATELRHELPKDDEGHGCD